MNKDALGISAMVGKEQVFKGKKKGKFTKKDDTLDGYKKKKK